MLSVAAFLELPGGVKMSTAATENEIRDYLTTSVDGKPGIPAGLAEPIVEYLAKLGLPLEGVKALTYEEFTLAYKAVTVRKRWPTEGKGKWKVWGLGSTEGIRYGKVWALRAYRAQGVRCALSLCVLWALLDRLRNSVSPTASTVNAGRCTPSGTWASRMAALSSTANRCTQLVQNDVEAMKNSAPAAAPNRPSHTRRTWR